MGGQKYQYLKACFCLPSRIVILEITVLKIIRGKQQGVILNKLTKITSNESNWTSVPRAHETSCQNSKPKQNKRGETEKITLLTDFCLLATMKTLPLYMPSMRSWYLLLHLLYQVQLPQSPISCAQWTCRGSWSSFFPFPKLCFTFVLSPQQMLTF